MIPESQLSDLPSTMLKKDFAAVPLAQTTDDLVKILLTLELASHSEKLLLKKEQLIAKVQKDETDRSSVEVRVAILTARIRNYQEHLQKHHKDKANKRRMLMAIDTRKKLLKNLRLVRYDAFENVCQQLGITYTFPPEYYRRITRRWLAKKAFCIKVFKEKQKQKAEKKKLKMEQTVAAAETQ
ncbi:small ribosomal subunit protein uS15m [Diretmus argenteus]